MPKGKKLSRAVIVKGEARGIMYLVVSVRLSVHPTVHVCVRRAVSCLVRVKVKGWGQGQNVWLVAVDIRGSACQVQQKAITLKFGEKGGQLITSPRPRFVCVSVLPVGVCR